MAKPKGSPKTGGRQKGSSFAGMLRKKIEEMGIDLPELFMENLSQVSEPAKKCELILRFMEFVYPRPRVEIELSAHNMDVEQLKQFMREGLVRLKSEGTPGN